MSRCFYCHAETTEPQTGGGRTLLCVNGLHTECPRETTCGYPDAAKFSHPCRCECHTVEQRAQEAMEQADIEVHRRTA